MDGPWSVYLRKKDLKTVYFRMRDEIGTGIVWGFLNVSSMQMILTIWSPVKSRPIVQLAMLFFSLGKFSDLENFKELHISLDLNHLLEFLFWDKTWGNFQKQKTAFDGSKKYFVHRASHDMHSQLHQNHMELVQYCICHLYQHSNNFCHIHCMYRHNLSMQLK